MVPALDDPPPAVATSPEWPERTFRYQPLPRDTDGTGGVNSEKINT